MARMDLTAGVGQRTLAADELVFGAFVVRLFLVAVD